MNRLVLALALVSIASSLARAEEAPAPRPVPDYDGRGDDPTTVGDVALWVPRVLLSPLYLVSEYVVRRPMVWLISRTGQKTARELAAFVQFGPNDTILVLPTALIDLGFKPSVGVYGRWKDFLAEDNTLQLHAATGGPDLNRITLADRIASHDKTRSLQLRGEYMRRQDGLFFGTGLNNLESNKSRYGFELLEAMLELEAEPWRASTFRVFARLRDMDFQPDDTCCGDPPLALRLEDGTLESASGAPLGPPPGLGGYSAYTQGVRMILDTRRERPHNGSGFQLGVDGQYALDAGDPLARRWLQYGATASVYVDLTGQNRVLRFGVLALATQPIAGEVPFTELPDLGGVGPLKGFVEGWVIGPSAAVAGFDYTWPIWIWLDGNIHAALGNAFGQDFAGFDLDEGRFSTGIGVRTTGERDHVFDLLLAFGTAPLRDGAGLDSVRFVFGGLRVF